MSCFRLNEWTKAESSRIFGAPRIRIDLGRYVPELRSALVAELGRLGAEINAFGALAPKTIPSVAGVAS